MNSLNTISVFCGSSRGNGDSFMEGATAMAEFLADQGVAIVYGGAKVGLMGAVADAALRKNGKVIGVIPDFIKSKEIAHENLTELITVTSMHERKTIMHEKSDGAIILPGGFGTLDEMFELLTWGQLGLHTKPIGILNIDGFYDHLISCMDNMVSSGFLRGSNRDMLIIGDDIHKLFDAMVNYEPPLKPKWLDLDQV
ncbi:MAG TPA: TIGR00730 family Rossman fold protein [Saprospiraceae bacterium]|nr:TIGR00730 family Rossman fold protein [Saprospiraceae bacterium]HMU03873.1 TIGR00730 family Rossman fold protein [Saprospiraceae bacterium]